MEKIKSISWTKEENKKLAELLLDPSIKKTMDMCPHLPGRTYKAILGRVRRGRIGDPPGKIVQWTTEEDNLLREHLPKVSYVRDLYPYFPGRTRNSILGRVHRLGIGKNVVFRETPKEGRGKSTKKRANKKMVNVVSIQNKRNKQDKRNKEPELFVAPEGVHLVSFFDLRKVHCRFPYDKHDDKNGLRFMYCGKKAVEGSSYCPKHFDVANKPERR